MKLLVGNTVEVQGWVMLRGFEEGRWTIVSTNPFGGSEAYTFQQKSRKRRFYASQIDPFLRKANDPDTNKIVLVG